MTQDTRKDRRVKIVSLNVRYKSATVDEFIENHSYDVSKGGIFIKTPNPFPPGTLLKFEIRLSGDQAVIAGVGRVVWKRDAGTASNERPAGMGVKFIKVDDASKGVIDKLVLTKADAGKAYESESITDVPTETPAPVGVAAKPAPAAGSGSGAIRSPLQRKQTMMGIGSVSPSEPPRPAGSPSSPPAVSVAPVIAAGGMFPATNSQAEMPAKQEQTVMKQAAELLEEALKEAGGSMEEIGQNPLFTPAADGSKPIEIPAAKKSDLAVTAHDRARPSSKPEADERPQSDLEATKVNEPHAVATDLHATVPDESARAAPKPPESPGKVRASAAPATTRESPSAKSAIAELESEQKKIKTVPPAARPAAARPAEEAPKSSGSMGFIVVFVVLAAGAAGVYFFRDKIFGTTEQAPTAVTSAPAAPKSTTPPAPSSAEIVPATTTADAAVAEATDAGLALDASKVDAAAAIEGVVDAAKPAATVVRPPYVPPPPTTAPPPPTTAPPATTNVPPPATTTAPPATTTAPQPPPTQTTKPPPPSTGTGTDPYSNIPIK